MTSEVTKVLNQREAARNARECEALLCTARNTGHTLEKRLQAIEDLGALGKAEAGPGLLEILEQRGCYACHVAVMGALAKVGYTPAIGALSEIVHGHDEVVVPDPARLPAARQALRSLMATMLGQLDQDEPAPRQAARSPADFGILPHRPADNLHYR